MLLNLKDTPPTTPRGTGSTGSTLNGSNTSSAATSVQSSNAQSPTNPPVGPPKGKLRVKIQEARNLLPCKYPYVVCTFESNEFISNGPRRSFDGCDVNGNDNDGAATPTTPGGRSIAIPMNSRQSSSTSLTEMQGMKNGSFGITNPKWDHEAVLYVQPVVFGVAFINQPSVLQHMALY
jgi:hypothetical protein